MAQNPNQCDARCKDFCGISLVNICFSIATFDLVQALYFLVHSVQFLIADFTSYAVFSTLGSFLWIMMVVLLFWGLCTFRVRLILIWLVFSVFGIIGDIIFFVYTIAVSDYIEGIEVAQFSLLYIGIVIEWACIYIVYKYCNTIDQQNTEAEPKKLEHLEENRLETANDNSKTKPTEPNGEQAPPPATEVKRNEVNDKKAKNKA